LAGTQGGRSRGKVNSWIVGGISSRQLKGAAHETVLNQIAKRKELGFRKKRQKERGWMKRGKQNLFFRKLGKSTDFTGILRKEGHKKEQTQDLRKRLPFVTGANRRDLNSERVKGQRERRRDSEDWTRRIREHRPFT